MPHKGRPRAALGALLAAGVAAGCASPAQKYDRAAQSANISEHTVQGARFHHKIYRNNRALRGGALHVFIEGDTSVNQALRSRPPDPTPRHLLMLHLMQEDKAQAILLGRPCYHGTFTMDSCEIRHIGPERYSAETIESMTTALQNELDHSGARQVIFFGYSGGGTVAMLMAARYPGTAAIVTLGGNLDNAALVAHHNSPPLSGSLDPAHLPPFPRSVVQLHFFGASDMNVPAYLAQKTLTRQNVHSVIFPGIDHECCWQDVWPEILARLQSALTTTAITSQSQIR